MHYMIAVLCHDIGYVKGVCKNDTKDMFATGVGDEMVYISPEGTDVALTPYHVNRSKLFVRERFGTDLLQGYDEIAGCGIDRFLYRNDPFPFSAG